MKKLILYSVFALLFWNLTGCMDCVDGEGHIITETRDVSSFRKVELRIPAFVEVGTASKTLVRINAQQNIASLITTRVKGDKLIIDASRCIGHAEEVQVSVFTTALEEIEVKGSGTVKTKHPVITDELELEVEGSGKIFADTYANKVEVEIEGSGEVVVNGTTVKQKIKIEGSGEYNGMGLKAYESKVKVEGSGKAELSSLNVLDVKIEGSGRVIYSGSPQLTTKISGSGTVSKMK